MRLLLVEDDPHISEFVGRGLRAAGYAVDAARDGEEAYALAVNEPYDAAVVDLMLPRLDGLSLIERLRQGGSAVPVLILSAKRTVDDRVRGLRAGGDDYMVKPFAFSELLARVQALLRRATAAASPTRLSAGPIGVDLLTREATRAGRRIDLQPREFALLEYLVRNAGRVVSRTELLGHVWDFDFDPQTNVVEVLVHRLRQKVDLDFDPPLIRTVRGMGYVLRVP
jgi:two-component system OmpR family response regulator